ncbi:alpha/beta fold hydrolase [Mycolicibacterium baixiangningiae]|uniref:alpha/beta fold hydrolase n=1 Tax=Mycolicibacterium baixiangningiae TaxID=2761578 RepID=UPI001D019BB6|nr:alpha/beta fold hydrolase [Mycolicibacterium baixiangningiae]
MAAGHGERKELRLLDFSLESGVVLVDAQISYRTHGSLSASGDNAVLLFTYYTGDDGSYQPWIGPGRPIDPTEHFVVIVNHFGGGVSSSPSTSGTGFPDVRIGDNVHAAKLVLDHLGVQHLRLVAGWSLGGMQSLDFAATYPECVSTVFALCSAARCSPINQVFLDSVSATLTAGNEIGGDDHPAVLERLDAFGRVYAGWAYCEQFFAEEIYREFGYASPADVLEGWGKDHQAMHAGNLMASLRMWRLAGGEGSLDALSERLGHITARTIFMPSVTDTYFTVTENLLEVAWLNDGEVRPMVSPLGHVAGRPGIRAEEQDEVDACLRELMKTTQRQRIQQRSTSEM